jgi:hypothetical protein
LYGNGGERRARKATSTGNHTSYILALANITTYLQRLLTKESKKSYYQQAITVFVLIFSQEELFMRNCKHCASEKIVPLSDNEIGDTVNAPS